MTFRPHLTLRHASVGRGRLGTTASLLAMLALMSGCAGATPAPSAPMDAVATHAVATQATLAPDRSAAMAPIPGASDASLMAGAATTGPAPVSAGVTRGGAVSAKEPKSGDDKLVGDALLIFTGTLSMQVDQKLFGDTIDQVVDAAAELGGYVAEQTNQSVTVRVPSKSFRSAMRSIEKLGEVTNRGVQAEDVSEEYNDLEVRLKSLRATRDRLEEFLARAKNIQEVLQVEEQLSRLNGEIDRIEGRMRFLAKRAAFSTITVSLQPKPSNVVIAEKSEPKAGKPKTLPLPIDWLGSMGLNHLLDL